MGDGDGDANGDGDGEGNDDGQSLPPAAPAELQLSVAAIKRFEFTWTPVPDADSYRLLERIHPDDDFAPIGAELLGGSLILTVPLHRRVGTTYVLQSCNTAGCVDSPPVEVAPTLAEAIGYIKASNAAGEDYFGGAVALSADGKTLAVAASWEDSDATGVDGDQASDPHWEHNSGAVYVFVEVDGVWSQQAYLKASNTDGGDHFGSKLALSASGDVLAVGAIGERGGSAGVGADQTDNSVALAGAVYVFERQGQIWSQQVYIKAPSPDAWDRFGFALALAHDGNTLAVGAYGEDSAATGIDGDMTDDSADDAGAVFLYEREGANWEHAASVKASNTGAGDNFGFAVALSGAGDRLAVGAWEEDSSAIGVDGDQASDASPFAGAVYVFDRLDSGWEQTAYIKGSNTEAGDRFGSDVTLSAAGDRLVVGALLEDSAATGVRGEQADNTVLNSGAAYVFDELADGWAQRAYLKSHNPHEEARFGNALAISDDGQIIAVGAFEEDNAATGIDGPLGVSGAYNSGSAYVFELRAGTWRPRAYIKAPNTDAWDTFGGELALSSEGDLLVVTAQGEASSGTGLNAPQGDNARSSSGAVYLY